MEYSTTRTAFSGVTDCYQPIEASYRLTRRCLEVCREFRNPVGIVTKSLLVRRDIDLLADLARRGFVEAAGAAVEHTGRVGVLTAADMGLHRFHAHLHRVLEQGTGGAFLGLGRPVLVGAAEGILGPVGAVDRLRGKLVQEAEVEIAMDLGPRSE